MLNVQYLYCVHSDPGAAATEHRVIAAVSNVASAGVSDLCVSCTDSDRSPTEFSYELPVDSAAPPSSVSCRFYRLHQSLHYFIDAKH